MNKQEFIRLMQRRVAQTAIGPSALRNQGSSGLIGKCRNFLEEEIDLKEFRDQLMSSNYSDYLNELTQRLMRKFPVKARNWGTARKGLNLFFRDVIYNKYLAEYLKLPADFEESSRFVNRLELPLDKDVAVNLTRVCENIPKWTGVKHLNPDVSRIYQEQAFLYAESQGMARIHLDLIFWRKEGS